ncbi:MAG TPA: VWA domain-containing protein [Acidobacteriaceae bacterium]|nr:VWA domain-containing protein [Acidobacteriaceae bacterium]
MTMAIRWLIAVSILGLAAIWPPAGAAAQAIPPANGIHEPPPQASPQAPYEFSVDSTLVNVDVMVTDEDGRVLDGLKHGNFRVLDNGKPQQIRHFSPTRAPITIVMLVEHSSASYQYFAYKAAWWGSGFLNHLEPQDWVALMTYDIKPKVEVDFTHNRAEVRDALASLGPPGFHDINLFDALLDTLDKLDHVRGRKTILLLATGANTFSSSNLDDVFNRLKESDVTIFSVGLAEQEYVRYGGTDITYLQSKSWLDSFAQRTGGMAFFPRFEGELPDVFRSVATFLRSEYTLSFSPPPESRDGRYHRLKVEIVGADGKPLKVTDEKGKRRKVIVYAREGYTAPKEKAPVR